jgi:hypothetical protein
MQKPTKTLPPTPPPSQAKNPVQGAYVRGIRVSRDQGDVDWSRVLEDPARLTFGVFQATYGTQGVDSKAKRNREALLALRGEIVAGCYHVTHPALAPGLTLEQDAKAEAENFAPWCEGLQLPPCVDVQLQDLTPDDQALWLRVFLTELESLTKRKPMICTVPGNAQTLLRCSPWLSECPLWIQDHQNPYIRTREDGTRIYGAALAFEGAEVLAYLPVLKPWASAHGWQFSGGASGNRPGNFIMGSNGFTECIIFDARTWEGLFAHATL